MKEDKNKIREPFPPENTPQPPQIKDPSRPHEDNEGGREKIQAEKKKKDGDKRKPTADEKSKGKLVNEGTDINDETTA